MYNNVGAKIKTLAEVLCAMGILASFIIGAIGIQSSTFFAIVFIILGCFVSWISFMLLYGFGELIDETVANRETNDRILDILESQYCHEQETQPVADNSTGL